MKRLIISQDNCVSQGVFVSYNFANTSMPLQGYKIHVSATYFNYPEVRDIVKSYCKRKRVNFKYIAKRRDFLISVSKLAPVTFSGKYFTLYPENDSHAKKILADLYPKLKHLSGPKITTDRQYENSILQYRYGDFVDEKIITEQGGRDTLKLLPDKREVNYFKPPEAHELFEEDATKSMHVSKVNDYTPLSSIFVSNFGGTYIFKKDKTLFIAKEARPHLGASSLDEPISRREYENTLRSKLPSNFPTPKFIEAFYFREHHYSIYEYVEGSNLRDWKPNLLLNFVWNQSKERKEEIEKLVHVLIDLFTSILLECKNINLIINDIKADNFIFDSENKKLTLIDLDFSFFVGDKPFFIRNALGGKDRVINHENEVRKVGVLLVDLITNSSLLASKATTMQAIINYFRLFCSYYKVDQKVYQNILYFLRFKKPHLLKKMKIKSQPYYEQPLEQTLTFDVKKLENLDLTAYIFEEESTAERGDLDFDESINLLWKQIYHNIKANNQEHARQAINELVEKRVREILTHKTLFDHQGNFLLYLNNGNAKLVLLLQMFEKQFATDEFRSLFDELVEPIKAPFLLQPTFLGGLPGIIYTHLEIYKYSQQQQYLDVAKKQLQVLKLMAHKGKFYDIAGNVIPDEDLAQINKIFEIFREV